MTEKLPKAVRNYLKKIGKRGGKVTGEAKVRGGSEYYRKLRDKALKKNRGAKTD